MEKLQSYHMDTDMIMRMSVSMMGQAVDMDMKLTAATDVQREPMQSASRMTTELMGETVEMLSYFFADEEGSFDGYLSVDGGETWEHSTITADELPNITGIDSVKWPTEFLAESAKSFSEVGNETVNGRQATRFDGVLEGEAVGKAVEASGVLDSMGGVLPFDLTKVFDELSGRIPVSFWLDDKSGMLVRYDMDLTELFSSVWDSMLAELLESEGLDGTQNLTGLGLEMTLSEMNMSVKLSDFDAVGEIILPEAAKAA